MKVQNEEKHEIWRYFEKISFIGSYIEIYLDNVNVVLINGTTQTALTYATIVAEYLKN